jgi:hypothetical protein
MNFIFRKKKEEYHPRACNRPADKLFLTAITPQGARISIDKRKPEPADKLAALGVVCVNDCQVYWRVNIPPDVLSRVANDLVVP